MLASDESKRKKNTRFSRLEFSVICDIRQIALSNQGIIRVKETG